MSLFWSPRLVFTRSFFPKLPKLDAWKEKSDYNRLKQIKSILLPLYFVKSLLFRGITFYVQSSSGRPPAFPMSNIVAVLIQQSLQTMKMWGGDNILWLWGNNFFLISDIKNVGPQRELTGLTIWAKGIRIKFIFQFHLYFSLALYKSRRDMVAPSPEVKHDRADVKLLPWAKVTLGDMTMST